MADAPVMMDGTDDLPLPPPGTFWRIGATDHRFNAQFRCPSAPVARRYALRSRGLADAMGCPVAVSARGRRVRVQLETHLRSLVFLTTVVLGHEVTLAEVLDA